MVGRIGQSYLHENWKSNHRIKGLTLIRLEVERCHYKFDLSSSSCLREVTAGGYATTLCPNMRPVILLLFDMMDDARLRLAGY